MVHLLRMQAERFETNDGNTFSMIAKFRGWQAILLSLYINFSLNLINELFAISEEKPACAPLLHGKQRQSSMDK